MSAKIIVTPLSTLDNEVAAAAAIQSAAFGDSPLGRAMEPPERRPSPEIRKRRAVLRMKSSLNSEKVMAMKACTEDGQIVGIALWNKPGFREKPLRWEEMDDEAREAYTGMDLDYINEFRAALEKGRDEIGGDYWHLSVLAVSPVHQKLRIGSKLLDSGLAIVDSHTPALPAFLEATPAGGKLYRSRGFETKLEVPIKGLDYPFPIMVRPARSG